MRLRSRLYPWFSALASLAFVLGPATGAGRALHLSFHHDSHDEENCPVGVAFTVGTAAAETPVPLVIERFEPAVTQLLPAEYIAPATTFAYQPLAPRPPPA